MKSGLPVAKPPSFEAHGLSIRQMTLDSMAKSQAKGIAWLRAGVLLGYSALATGLLQFVTTKSIVVWLSFALLVGAGICWLIGQVRCKPRNPAPERIETILRMWILAQLIALADTVSLVCLGIGGGFILATAARAGYLIVKGATIDVPLSNAATISFILIGIGTAGRLCSHRARRRLAYRKQPRDLPVQRHQAQ